MTGSRMQEQMYLLEEALEQGARGVSFGLQYEPDVFVTLDEFKKVAAMVKQKDNNTDIKTSETPSGIDYVFINGTLAMAQGDIKTKAKPGAVI